MFLRKVKLKISSVFILISLVSCNLSLFSGEAEDLASEVAGKKSMLSEEMELIAEQHLNMGKDLMNEGNFDAALDEFNTVIGIQPENERAKDYRLSCINAIANKNKPVIQTDSKTIKVTSARTQEQIKAVTTYREGLQALKNNDKNLAVNLLSKSIAFDPFYIPAKRLLRRVLELENEDIDRDHDILWKERMNDVRKSWLPTGKANKLTLSSDEKQTEIISDAKRRMIEASKQNIPEINFTQAHLRDVLQYLSKITGVNIILDEFAFSGTTTTGNETSEMSSETMTAVNDLTDTITISLSNIPLIEALKYILKIKGLKHRIDDYAILVSTAERIGSDEMETRYYNLSAGIGDFTEFKLNTDGVAVGIKDKGASTAFQSEADLGEKTTIKDVLVNSGVPFPPSSSVFMDKRTGTLICHNTPENLAMIEKILEIIDKPPFQVNIQAKFVRISQSDLEELGFEWLLQSSTRVGNKENGQNKWQIDGDDLAGDSTYLNNALGDTSDGLGIGAINGIDTTFNNFVKNSNILAFSGILTDPQFRVVVHALDKSGNADLLSAPSVTTVNNQQAQIELVDEIIYPGEYDLQPPTMSDDGGIILPGLAVPGDFLTRDVGVILNVTPSVGADRKTITLTLIPEVSEHIGWKDYGVTFESNSTVNGATVTNTQRIPMEQPIFRTSNVSTTVIVNDGETIVLGGLIEEKKKKVNDKTPILGDIPFLGRLFRHEYEQNQKMNLMIFVTAKLINASGEDLHPSA